VRGPFVERDPAWSPDGRRIAFAADRGDGFDIYLVAATGGAPERLTFLPGDERWPAWTPDGRLIFAHRAGEQWDLMRALPTAPPAGGTVASSPEAITDTPFDETEPSVSPDGAYVLFASNRESDGGDVDLWIASLKPGSDSGAAAATASASSPAADSTTPGTTVAGSPPRPVSNARVVRVSGAESSPVWAPDGKRIAFSAIRQGLGSIWVAEIDIANDKQSPRPAAPPLLVSRRGGQVAWSPDGRTLLISDTPDPEPTYNGNPRRDDGEAPPLFALSDGSGGAFNLRLVPAPRPPDDGEVPLTTKLAVPGSRWLTAFDGVWRTLQTLYYGHGANANAWQALYDLYAPRAAAARDEASLETVVDAMIAEQPLIKPAVTSSHAVVVSGHRLASEAGVHVLERGGNIVDAAIAVSFALGVVEPDASGIGGDGMAVLFLKGMTEPTVIEYKDQTPIHATLDNPEIFRDGRLVGDGPAAANIPGVVAGMDMLYQKYGSKRVAWDDLIAPAIRHAEEGYVLDDALPTSVAEGQSFLRKYDAAREIFMPGGRVPRAGDRFVNRDYASTLRAIAKGGAREFYQGSIAKKIAADMSENGGIIGYEDLAQYRAVERQPLTGRFRDHVVYAAPPPVSSGASLVESLQILDHYAPKPGAGIARDADYFHYALEAWKQRHPMTQVADPALWPINLSPHLDRAHAAAQFQQINPLKASELRGDTGENGGRGEGERERDRDRDRIGSGTTAFVVADSDGNMIAVTQTLSTWGGNFYVSKGLGFLYNNHLRSSRVTRGAYGQLLPLSRSSSTSTPTLVFRDANGVQTPRLAVGAAGNAWIVSSVYSIITQVIDGGQPMQAAVEAPRFLIGRDPSDASNSRARIQIEDRFPRALLTDLTRRGHVFQKIGRKGEVRYGYASGALVDVGARRVEGGADPRRSHAAVAWSGATGSQ
jgi:gamma-glutamyltranspeptidase